jgi:hypothetical protein
VRASCALQWHQSDLDLAGYELGMLLPSLALALTNLIFWNTGKSIINMLTAARPGVFLTLLAGNSRTHN